MGVLIGHASIDENGHVRGGRPGDQTGREVCTRQWYDHRPHRWNKVIRPLDAGVAERMARSITWMSMRRISARRRVWRECSTFWRRRPFRSA